MRTRHLIVLLGLVAGACATAQSTPPAASSAAPGPRPATAAPAATPPASAPASGVAAAPPEAYAYHPDGRRDPFVSLLNRGVDEGPAVGRATGLEGLAVSDISLRGIVNSGGALVAMVEAPDSRTFIVRQNDKLRDARVKAITAEAIVFLQLVTDPLAAIKEREVRKPLRPNEEGK